MHYTDQETLRNRIGELTGRWLKGPIQLVGDTTNFFRIDRDMVLRLGRADYLVQGHAVEGRFGIDDQPKFWVKYALDLETGARKVIKLVFHEDFPIRLGRYSLTAHRSPEKESKVLEAVRGHPFFMQGQTVWDDAGNQVRIIDFIRGVNFFRYLNELELDHETYYHRMLPGLLSRLLEAVLAIVRLNSLELQHGDIRNDHIIIEEGAGRFVWIDFDYQVDHPDWDLWCLGNLLIFAVGKGNHTLTDVTRDPGLYPGWPGGFGLEPEDMHMIHSSRVANLRKLFPYISPELNDLLMLFAARPGPFFQDAGFLMDHLRKLVTGWA